MKSNQDKVFTLLMVLQEVNQRLLSQLIGNNVLKQDFKQQFNIYLKQGEKFRNKCLKLIEHAHGEDAAEWHEQDADNFYDLIDLVYDLDENKMNQLIEYAKIMLK